MNIHNYSPNYILQLFSNNKPLPKIHIDPTPPIPAISAKTTSKMASLEEQYNAIPDGIDGDSPLGLERQRIVREMLAVSNAERNDPNTPRARFAKARQKEVNEFYNEYGFHRMAASAQRAHERFENDGTYFNDRILIQRYLGDPYKIARGLMNELQSKSYGNYNAPYMKEHIASTLKRNMEKYGDEGGAIKNRNFLLKNADLSEYSATWTKIIISDFSRIFDVKGNIIEEAKNGKRWFGDAEFFKDGIKIATLDASIQKLTIHDPKGETVRNFLGDLNNPNFKQWMAERQ